MQPNSDRAREERVLFTRLAQRQDAALRDQLVERYLPLARQLARRYQRPDEPLDDLMQVAALGLVKAIDRFDVSREIAFSSYAVPTILGEIKRHFRDRTWSVRVPRDLQEMALKVERAVGELTRDLHRQPSVPELARHLGITEEVEACRSAGVAVHVIPGLSSPVAVPAVAGIPVTHRQVASSFAVVTGHEDPTKPESAMRWAGLANGPDTLIFLMGVENLGPITESLLRHGRPASQPAAAIRWATTSHQQIVAGTLGDIVERVRAADLRPPAVLIVGDVVGLRESLDWRARLPLAGRTVPVWQNAGQAFHVYRRHTGALLLVTLGSAGIVLLTSVNIWLIARAIEPGGISLLEVLVINPIIVFVALALPLSPGGLGVRQGAFTLTFLLVGASGALGLATGLLQQAIGYLVSIPGGILWMRGGRRQAGALAALHYAPGTMRALKHTDEILGQAVDIEAGFRLDGNAFLLVLSLRRIERRVCDCGS